MGMGSLTLRGQKMRLHARSQVQFISVTFTQCCLEFCPSGRGVVRRGRNLALARNANLNVRTFCDSFDGIDEVHASKRTAEDDLL